MIRAVLVVCALVSAAAADGVYRLSPGAGALVPTAVPCGAATRTELAKLIGDAPLLLVGETTMTLEARGTSTPASEVLDNVGWWYFGTKHLIVTVGKTDRAGTRIRVAIVRHLDETACSEAWEGRAAIELRPRGARSGSPRAARP